MVPPLSFYPINMTLYFSYLLIRHYRAFIITKLSKKSKNQLALSGTINSIRNCFFHSLPIYCSFLIFIQVASLPVTIAQEGLLENPF
ncbi:hypothetical protein CW304_00960 [Bacillus sp. UFRGS-B20]|nr:hypothetical protein CW304_00960 [Bacillus sp. UFRGS-B20]